MKLSRYEGETNQVARLARIHHSLASHLYLSKDYYGFEVFAMAMEAYSILEADQVLQLDSSSDLGALRSEATKVFGQLKLIVSPSWFSKRNTKGVFAAIFTVLDKNIGAPTSPLSTAVEK